MAKTPFELRYDSLALARTHLMDQFYAEFEQHKTGLGDAPVYPAMSDVIALADTMRAFVDGSPPSAYTATATINAASIANNALTVNSITSGTLNVPGTLKVTEDYIEVTDQNGKPRVRLGKF